MTVIINYGVGNLFSLSSSLKYIGLDCKITRDAREVAQADKIILPGVGAFADARDKLEATGLIPVLDSRVREGVPLLGICLGMQLLFEESFEYGRHKGLGYLPGKICPLEDDLRAAGLKLKVPQIGWNSLDFHRDNPLLKNIKQGDFVYYVHSYYAKDCGESLVASSEYGVTVPGLVAKNNVFGCQFHPEKSGKVGLSILKAFEEI